MPKIDEIDKKILALLQKDASLSSAEVAERIGSSQSPVWRRINAMEKSGVISKKVVIIDAKKAGFGFTVFVRLKMTEHGKNTLSNVEKQLSHLPHVQECQILLGDIDFRLRVVARDLEDFERFLQKHLLPLEGIREITSRVVVRNIKDTRELPL